MNRKTSDNELDRMLKSYCQRTRQASFNLETEEKRMTNRSKGIFLAAASTCMAAAIALGASQFFNFTSGTPSGFTVKAYAAEATADSPNPNTAATLNGVKAQLVSDDKSMKTADIDFSKNGWIMAATEGIYFETSGETLTSLDIECKNGSVSWFNSDKKDTSTDLEEYYKSGKKLESVPCGKGGEHIFIEWEPTAISEGFERFLDKKGVGLEGYKELFCEDEAAANKLVEEYYGGFTLSDYARAFEDEITLTAHYSGGGSETAVIEIGVDVRDSEEVLQELYESDSRYIAAGYYTLKYK